jgi:hypothetical protein
MLNFLDFMDGMQYCTIKKLADGPGLHFRTNRTLRAWQSGRNFFIRLTQCAKPPLQTIRDSRKYLTQYCFSRQLICLVQVDGMASARPFQFWYDQLHTV